jgi:hypothetical protein
MSAYPDSLPLFYLTALTPNLVVVLAQCMFMVLVHEWGHILVGRALGYDVGYSTEGGPHAEFAPGQIILPFHRALIAVSGATAFIVATGLAIALTAGASGLIGITFLPVHAFAPATLALMELMGLASSTFFRGTDGWHCLEGLWFRQKWDGNRVGVATRDKLVYLTIALAVTSGVSTIVTLRALV